MATPDEPLQPQPDEEIEEISPEFIIAPGETLPGAVLEPGTEPTETTLTRTGTSSAPAQPPVQPREPSPRPTPRRRPTPSPPVERALSEPQQPAPPDATTRVLQSAPSDAPHARFPLFIALLFLLFGAGAGFVAGRFWEQHRADVVAAPSAPPPAGEAKPAAAAAREDRPAATPKRSAKPTRPPQPARTLRKAAPAGAKGKLDVTAPAGAEVFLDGRRIGKGSVKVDVAPGSHRIEVRLGKARTGENFVSEPGVTWTYEVTPTRQ